MSQKKYVHGSLTSKKDVNDLVAFIADNVLKVDQKELLKKAGVKSAPGELDIVDLNDIAIASGLDIKIRVEWDETQELKKEEENPSTGGTADQELPPPPAGGTDKLPFA